MPILTPDGSHHDPVIRNVIAGIPRSRLGIFAEQQAGSRTETHRYHRNDATLPHRSEEHLEGLAYVPVPMIVGPRERMSRKRLIAYRRVSTARQGVSGLGLEAQDAAVASYAHAAGGVILRAYTEVETGKRSDRPELGKALSDCKRSKAVLVLAKLDRLARNARFLLTLIESGVDVAFCDLPSVPPGAVGKFLLTQMAAVAELEAGLTSERTKAALAAYKARGGLLGAARPGAHRLKGGANAKAARRAGEVSAANAAAAYADLVTDIAAMRAEGLSLRQIAGRLNAEGHTTRRGKPWNPVQVGRVLGRASQ